MKNEGNNKDLQKQLEDAKSKAKDPKLVKSIEEKQKQIGKTICK